MKVSVSGYVVSVIVACGGGGDATAACSPKAVRVQLFGDSTMYGYDSFTRAQAVPSPAADLQAEMDARFGRGAVVVALNAAIGAGTREVITGTAGYQAFPLGVDADFVVVNYGINDQDVAIGVPIDQYEANLRQMVKLSPARVIFETPNNAPGPNPRLAAYAQRMRDVAASTGRPVADTYAFVSALPRYESFFADRAHPNAELYRKIVAGSLAPVVAAQVAPLRCQ